MMVLKLSKISVFQPHHILRAYKSNVADISFDPRIIRKYKRVVDDYWNPSGKTQKFHQLNRLLVPQIYNSFFITVSFDVDKLIPRSEFQRYKVLDIGCGGGITSESLAHLGFDVVGIDPNPDLIHVAKSHQKKNKALFDKNLSYYHTTVEEFVKLHEKEFDAIVISEVLEYMPFWGQKQFLKLCTSFCKDDGKVFITTITDSPKIYLRYLQFFLLGLFRGTNYNCFNGISKNALTAILRSCDCSVRMTRGFDLDFRPIRFEFKADEGLPWMYLFAIKQSKIVFDYSV